MDPTDSHFFHDSLFYTAHHPTYYNAPTHYDLFNIIPPFLNIHTLYQAMLRYDVVIIILYFHSPTGQLQNLRGVLVLTTDYSRNRECEL